MCTKIECSTDSNSISERENIRSNRYMPKFKFMRLTIFGTCGTWLTRSTTSILLFFDRKFVHLLRCVPLLKHFHSQRTIGGNRLDFFSCALYPKRFPNLINHLERKRQLSAVPHVFALSADSVSFQFGRLLCRYFIVSNSFSTPLCLNKHQFIY